VLKLLSNRPYLTELNVNPCSTVVTAVTSEYLIFPAEYVFYGFHNCHHIVNRLFFFVMETRCVLCRVGIGIVSII
jgi:hypothetical protein